MTDCDRMHIIVAERERRLLTGVRRAMREAGHALLSTSCPRTLRAALHIRPDVAICDADVVRGHEDSIRRALPHGTTVVVTGRGQAGVRAIAKEFGAAWVLLKPYDTADAT
jgi:DNA-binding response OmpR family regulator